MKPEDQKFALHEGAIERERLVRRKSLFEDC
jgi:hypothetical protein